MLFSVTVHIKDIKKHIYNLTELSIIEAFQKEKKKGKRTYNDLQNNTQKLQEKG